MSYVLDRFVNAGDVAEFDCPGSVKALVQISNGRVVLAFGQGVPVPIYGPDEPTLPIVGILSRRFDAIRVRAADPVSAPPPHVSITALPAGEA